MTNDTTNETEIETSERSLTVRRRFEAPLERVWDAWTNPDQIDQWWGPDGFTTTTDKMEVRPDGVWQFVMVGPDGDEYQNQIVYDEIVEPVRLNYTHGSGDDSEQFRVAVTFEEPDDGGTELTMEMHFESADELNEAVEFGADDGAKQTLEHLADYLVVK